MDPATLQSAAHAVARAIRVQIITPPGALTQERPEAAGAGRDEDLGGYLRRLSEAARTWVLLTEAAEGGWGIAGTAYGREEFAALAAAAAKK